MRRLPEICATLLVAMALSSCTSSVTPGRPVVLVSVPPQAWLVERLAGEFVDVEVMVPPGADPHIYEPTIRQLRAVVRASLYVKVGHPHFAFERVWFDRMAAENPDMRIVDASRGVRRHDGDPHLWIDADAMHAMAIHTAGALASVLPARAQEISARLVALDAEIDSLDAEIRRTLEPCRGQAFLVFHPAWGYFAEAYGLEQIAIERDGKTPAPADLARVIAAARQAGVRRVFVQPQTSTSSAGVVASEIGGRVVMLDPLARDWMALMREVAGAIREGCDDD